MVLAVLDDLLFASRIRAAASHVGVRVAFAASLAEAIAMDEADQVTTAILDLDNARLDIPSIGATLRRNPRLGEIATVGYASHVHADKIEAARRAGLTRVMARSAFARDLVQILTQAAGRARATPWRLQPSDMRVARDRIHGLVRRTPLVRSDWLSSLAGGTVLLKLESLQITSSFKARGALNAALARIERAGGRPQDKPTLVTASAGNAGRALAWAAERLGIRAIVFTPRDAPRTKLDAIGRHGADLRAEADSYEDAERRAKQFAAEQGFAWLSPYSDPDVIAGAATVALEILEDAPAVGAVLVPLGGGGLLAGIASAVKASSSGVEVIGVEAEASPAFTTALAAGRIVEVPVGPSIADGLVGNMDPETITFAIVRDRVDRVVMASEGALEAAVRGLVEHEHLIAEGAGVAGIAALMEHRVDARDREVAVVVSGANIDVARLARLLGGG